MSDRSQIRVLIVDDEELARDTVRLLLEDVSDFEVIGEAADGQSAVESIRELEPDLVFLDVQMPALTGMDVVAEIGASNMPAVVFATAYDEYAVKAFEASAIDYLIKPFSDERFESTLERVRTQFRQKRYADLENRFRSLLGETGSGDSSRPSRFMVKERGTIRFVDAEDVQWVEAAGDYVVLHAGKDNLMLRDTMTDMEDKLDPDSFVRVHRSHIVNINFVREIKSYFHGDYILYLNDGTELKVSRRYWPDLEALLSS